MAVSFERIPSQIRVPLFYAEVSNREASYLQMEQPSLLIGPMLPAGSATPLEPVQVRDPEDGYGLFGVGSVLADMVAAYRRNDNYSTLWAIPHENPTGATAMSFLIEVDGTATAPAQFALYIAGDRYSIPVAPGDTKVIVAGKIRDAIADDPFALVACTIAAGADADDPHEVTLTARQAGAIGNEIFVEYNYRGNAGGETIPLGMTISAPVRTAGVGQPLLPAVIAAMGDDEYDYIGFPYTDAASLDAIGEEMNDVTGRWAWDRQIYGHVFAARRGALNDLVTFGRTRNDPHVSVLGFAPSPTVSWRRAAALCAQAATSLRIDPARPLQTLPLVGILPPGRGDRFGIQASNSLLYNGVATEVEAGGAVAIQRCVTTYRVNQYNQPDPSWLDVQTPATLAFIIRFLRNRILAKFPRHKLASDGTPFGLGQAIVTPRIIRGELIAAYAELIELGVAENMDGFKRFLIVERDPVDPNRVNVLLPPDLVNQLRIFAMLVEFRLRIRPQAAAA